MRNERLLSTVYWAGAIMDFALAFVLLVPGLASLVFGVSEALLTPPARVLLAAGAVSAAGWGLLLIWGAQRAVAFRGLLAITAVVDVALGAVVFGALRVGLITAVRAGLLWALLALYVVASLWAHGRAGRSMMFY